MKANIKRDTEVVIADVDVDVCVGERGGLIEWSGSFEAGHHGLGFDDDEYVLELADGRYGRILIVGQQITGGSSAKLVRFQGTGPLKDQRPGII